MHTTSIIVKNGFLTLFAAVYDGLRARPVSHAAAATFLGCSIYVAHEGLTSLPIGGLANVLTALFVAVAVLQWLALGRKESCLDARDHERADAVIVQAWMFGVIETGLYALGGLALVAASGLDVYTWAGWSVALAAAGLFAFANFRVKWVSCDAVARRGRPTNGGYHETIFVPTADNELAPESFPDDWAEDPVVINFQKRIRHTNRVEERDAPARAQAQRPTAERLRLASKRIRTRVWREEKRQACA